MTNPIGNSRVVRRALAVSAVAAVALALGSAVPAQALPPVKCTVNGVPDNDGYIGTDHNGPLTGNDVIDCRVPSGAVVSIAGGPGDDEITLTVADPANAANGIRAGGGNGNDTITVNGGLGSADGATGGPGDDLITIEGAVYVPAAYPPAQVGGHDGNDRIFLNGDVTGGLIGGDNGNDELNLAGSLKAHKFGALVGDQGDDILLVAGDIDPKLLADGGGGKDLCAVNGSGTFANCEA